MTAVRAVRVRRRREGSGPVPVVRVPDPGPIVLPGIVRGARVPVAIAGVRIAPTAGVRHSTGMSRGRRGKSRQRS